MFRELYNLFYPIDVIKKPRKEQIMKKNTYFKILMAPLIVLTFGACSSNLYNQPQEYDDIYFTKADRKQATVITKTVETQPLNISKEKTPEIQKTYSMEEYSPEYVDPSLVEKYSNQKPIDQNSRKSLRVLNANQLNFNDFIWDFDHNNVEFKDLPLDWGKGYWSQIQFDNRVSSDYQFRNAWYDYYYSGYEESINNYFDQVSANQQYASSARYSSPLSFRPRIRIGLGFGYSYYNSYASLFGNFYDPFYDPYYYSGNSFFGYYDPFYVRTNVFFGTPFWCPPSYYNRKYYSNRPYYQNDGNDLRRRDAVRGPRSTRGIVASVGNDASNGITPRTRSEANLNSNSRGLNASNLNRGEKENNGRVINGRSAINGRISGNVNNDLGPRSSTSRTRTSAVTVNSRNSRVRTTDYNSRIKAMSSSNVRNRTTKTNNGILSRFSRAVKSDYDNPSRRTRTTNTSSFDRQNYGSSRSSSSRNNYSKPSNSRSSSNYSNRSSSSSRSTGSVKRTSSSSSRSTGSVKRTSSSSSRSSGSVRKSSTSSRSSSSSRSTGSVKKSGRSNN